MDTNNFIVNINIKTGNVYKDIANYVENRFDTSKYRLKDPYQQVKIKELLD